MITTYMIKGFFDCVRQKFDRFGLAPKFKYSSDLAFDATMRKYIVRVDAAHCENNAGDPNWVSVLWNRDMIRREYQGRNFDVAIQQDPVSVTDRDKYYFVLGTMRISMAFFSPSFFKLEALEEYLQCVEMFDNFLFTVPISSQTPIGLELRGSSVLWETESIERLGTDQFGSLANFTWNASINYPVMCFNGPTPLITDIYTDIYDETDSLTYSAFQIPAP